MLLETFGEVDPAPCALVFCEVEGEECMPGNGEGQRSKGVLEQACWSLLEPAGASWSLHGVERP